MAAATSDVHQVVGAMRTAGTLPNLMSHCAEKGNIEMMQYLYDQGAVDKLGNTLLKAIRADQMESVKWLVEHFPETEKIPDFGVMDVAARRGRVEMLQYFQSLGPSGVPGFFPVEVPAQQDGQAGETEGAAVRGMVVEDADLNRRVVHMYRYRHTWDPTDPMDDAAANGELAAVQWLHDNRPEGCTTAGMDDAAANGFLGVVKWLHGKRSEGCTSSAMDAAAGNGHLHTVQWLHRNTTAGCTSNAMVLAAAGGHLNVLKWLRENRSEGCTARAIERAVSSGYLEVVCWLRQYYPEYVPVNVTLPSSPKMFRVLLFFQAHYPNIFTPAFVESARDSVSGRAAKPNDAHILDWLKHNYHVSDVTEEQVDRRFDHLADQILGNIAQQVAGQLGGAVRVVRGHPVAGQPGPNAVLGMMMNNAVMVAHHDNGGDEDDDA